LYSSIYIAPINSHGQTEGLLVRLAPGKETSFKSDNDVGRLDGKREGRVVNLTNLYLNYFKLYTLKHFQ